MTAVATAVDLSSHFRLVTEETLCGGYWAPAGLGQKHKMMPGRRKGGEAGRGAKQICLSLMYTRGRRVEMLQIGKNGKKGWNDVLHFSTMIAFSAKKKDNQSNKTRENK